MANKHAKIPSTRGASEKSQVKTTTTFHSKPTRAATRHTTKNSNTATEGAPVTRPLRVGAQHATVTWEEHLALPYKTKHTLSRHSSSCAPRRSFPTT